MQRDGTSDLNFDFFNRQGPRSAGGKLRYIASWVRPAHAGCLKVLDARWTRRDSGRNDKGTTKVSYPVPTFGQNTYQHPLGACQSRDTDGKSLNMTHQSWSHLSSWVGLLAVGCSESMWQAAGRRLHLFRHFLLCFDGLGPAGAAICFFYAAICRQLFVYEESKQNPAIELMSPRHLCLRARRLKSYSSEMQARTGQCRWPTTTRIGLIRASTRRPVWCRASWRMGVANLVSSIVAFTLVPGRRHLGLLVPIANLYQEWEARYW